MRFEIEEEHGYDLWGLLMSVCGVFSLLLAVLFGQFNDLVPSHGSKGVADIQKRIAKLK